MRIRHRSPRVRARVRIHTRPEKKALCSLTTLEDFKRDVEGTIEELRMIGYALDDIKFEYAGPREIVFCVIGKRSE